LQIPGTKLLIAALLATAGGATAAEVDSFSVDSGFTYGYGNKARVSMQAELELMPMLDVTFSERVSMVASARVRLDGQDKLEPGRYSYATYSGASRPVNLGDIGSADIRDLYLEVRSDKGLMRLGKQQIVWGRLDGIKVLDLVNPQDFQEFIIDDFGDSRIGLWSAYFDYSIGNWRTEIAVVPDGTGHAIPESGAWYELTAPRFRFGASPDQSSPPVTTVSPGLSLDDAGVGLRLSRQLGPVEFSAVAYSGLDPEPLGRVVSTGGAAVVERFYERRKAFGLSFDVGLGATVLRAEYAFQPDRLFNTRLSNQLSTEALDQHRGAIGLDIDAPLGLFVNVQYLIDTVSDAPNSLVRPSSDRIGTLYLRRAFAYDTFTIEARLYHSFTDRDQLASINISYAMSDSTSVEFGAENFSGAAEGLFGQFVERDRMTLGVRHTF